MADLTAATADFLRRLVRLDPSVLVRARGGDLWSRVPWNVLVTRPGSVPAADDRTVRASEWLALGLDDPSSLERLDGQWRAGLPPATVTVRETLPALVIHRISAAAADTLRETESTGVRGRAVGARALRDALLDHVPITVTADTPDATPVRVPQRIVQAVVRVGFLPPVSQDDESTAVRIVTAGPWIGISTDCGTAWWRGPAGLTLSPHRA
jgi:hypothetical protein